MSKKSNVTFFNLKNRTNNATFHTALSRGSGRIEDACGESPAASLFTLHSGGHIQSIRSLFVHHSFIIRSGCVPVVTFKLFVHYSFIIRSLFVLIRASCKGSLLGRSWGRLEAILGHLGPSWGDLGDVLGRLGGILGRLGSLLERSWAVLGRPRGSAISFWSWVFAT